MVKVSDDALHCLVCISIKINKLYDHNTLANFNVQILCIHGQTFKHLCAHEATGQGCTLTIVKTGVRVASKQLHLVSERENEVLLDLDILGTTPAPSSMSQYSLRETLNLDLNCLMINVIITPSQKSDCYWGCNMKINADQNNVNYSV